MVVRYKTSLTVPETFKLPVYFLHYTLFLDVWVEGNGFCVITVITSYFNVLKPPEPSDYPDISSRPPPTTTGKKKISLLFQITPRILRPFFTAASQCSMAKYRCPLPRQSTHLYFSTAIGFYGN